MRARCRVSILTGIWLPVCVLPAWLLIATGCSQPDLERQSKINTYEFEQTPVFPDGITARLEVAGTVAQGDLQREQQLSEAPPVTLDLVKRGKQRYEQVCLPCHGYLGKGDGMVVQRGFPTPPDYHSQRLRDAPDPYYVQVITDGFGVMYSYAARVEPADRWAITYYIRALQKAALATADQVPAAIAEQWQTAATADTHAKKGPTANTGTSP